MAKSKKKTKNSTLIPSESGQDSVGNEMNSTIYRSYFDYALIIARVMKDKCWHLLWHFDLFDKVDRVYPETSYYKNWGHILRDATHIIDQIYLGSAFNAADFKWLQAKEIKLIINCTDSISNYYPDYFDYAVYPVEDLNQASLKQYYEQSYQKILEYAEQPILIHCYAGRSRSVSLVIYYLMRHYKMTATQSLDMIRRLRPQINVNLSFMEEIEKVVKEHK